MSGAYQIHQELERDASVRINIDAREESGFVGRVAATLSRICASTITSSSVATPSMSPRRIK
jgi:hypothetical protein